jgi:hypothetical protein
MDALTHTIIATSCIGIAFAVGRYFRNNIAAENIVSILLDRMEEDSDLWIGMTVSDPEHWAIYDVYTIEDYEKYMISCAIKEVSYDADGYKNRVSHKDYTLDQLQVLLDSYTTLDSYIDKV